MFFVFVAFEEGVEDESWVGERLPGEAVPGGYGAGVGRACFAHGREQGVVVGPISWTESVFHRSLGFLLLLSGFGDLLLYRWEAEVGARRVWKIFVDCLWSWVSVKLCRLGM